MDVHESAARDGEDGAAPLAARSAADLRRREVTVGVVATAARIALLPIRVLARSPVGPSLAAAGREAEADVTREVDEVLAGPVPDAVTRALASGELDAMIADALRDVIESPEVRRMLANETKSLLDEVVAALRRAAGRGDTRLDRKTSPDRERYGGLVSRGIGLGVDVALLQVALAVIGGVLAAMTSVFGHLGPWELIGGIVAAAWTLVVAGYFVLFWTTIGQTPGMRSMGVRVAGPNGSAPGAGRSLVRLVGLVLAIVPCFLGFLPVLFDRRRRALPDYLAGTVVVRS